MAKKILGLDLGLQSVGWAVVEMDDSDTPPQPPIVAAGVRIFPPAEVQKTSESPGLKRRTCRGQRRRLRRLRGRMNKIRVLFLKHGLLSADYNTNPTGKPIINLAKINTLHQEQNRAQGYDLWKLRVAALERKLEPEEWVAVLTQLAKRRGFKSNRKIPKEAKDDTGKMLTEANKNKELLSEKYQTVGEMLAKDERFAKNGVQIKRNKGDKIKRKKGSETDQEPADKPTAKAKPEHYTRTVLREQLGEEIIKLFECQRGFGNLHSGEELEKEYLKIWGYQQHFDQGNIEEMVGECPFEKDQKRAPKVSYTAESCRAWQDINHKLKNRNITKNKSRPITDEEKQLIFKRAQTAEKLTYADVRKLLKLNHCEGVVYKFKDVFYRSEDKQFATKIKTMVLSPKDKNDKTPPPKISDAKQKEIYDYGLADLSITYADIRRILALDERFYIKGCKLAEDPAKAEAKEFYKFPGFKKLRSALGEHWQKITDSHEQRAEKFAELAELAELCMFTSGEYKSTMLAEKFSSEIAHALKETTLPCEDEKETFTAMSGTYQIWQAAKGELWELLLQHPQTLDTIAEAVTYYKEDSNIRQHLQPLKEQYAEKDFAAIEELALCLNFSGIAGLSLVALRNILPHLQQGWVYSDACEKAGYEHSRPQTFVKRKKLPIIIDAQKARHLSPEMQQKLESGEAVKLEISNPRVLRAITQARKIINAVLEKHPDIDQVHIELLRDVARSPDERRKIKKGQDNFRAEKEHVFQRLKDSFPGHHPKSNDILKMRLWLAQDGFCPYSGKYMEQERLLDAGAFEIDHILPLSRSMDDSNNNKVLCLTAENRQKGNKIPYEYLGGNAQRWQEFHARVKNYPIGRRERMEKIEFNREQAQEHQDKWVESPESKWIAREFKNLIENHLQFANDKTGDNKKRVQTRNGTLTSFLRAQWGIHKSRDTHRHHALDAIVLACSTQSLVQRVSKWSKRKELWKTDEKAGVETVDPETGEIVETHFQEKNIPVPWGTLGYFHQDVLDSVSKVFVSQPARRKMSGEAHAETLDKQDKTSQHPKVRHGTPKKHGIPKDWSILRTDVFYKQGKYYLSLVRPYHLVKGELPQHYIAKSNEQGGKLDESFEFQFSLFPGDAVCIRKKADKPIKERFPPDEAHAGVLWGKDDKFITVVGYFRMTNATHGQITIEAHDKSWPEKEKASFHPGVQGLLSIQKLEIPLLGDVCINDIVQKEKFVVKEKKRRGLAKPGSRKPGKA